MTQFHEKFSKVYKVPQFEKIQVYNGIQISRVGKHVYELSQEYGILQFLAKCPIQDVNPCDSPLLPSDTFVLAGQRISFADFIQSNDSMLDINLYKKPFRQVNYTHPQMYRWFSRSESNCTLKQYQGGSILFRQNSALWQKVFSLWKKCAQFKQCMLPDGALIKTRNPPGGYIAHRDDQSALNFALVSVVGEEAFDGFDTLKPHITVRRNKHTR